MWTTPEREEAAVPQGTDRRRKPSFKKKEAPEMSAVAVVDASGRPLMPTGSYRARKLLKSGRAKIYKHRPVFTILITDRETGNTQPMEYCCDTGYQHIGISISSQKHEYVNEQRDMLPDETERHNDQRKYRRTRRNHKRYRKPRFDNRKGMIAKDGFAPSVRNKRDLQVNLFRRYCEVFPITSAVFEMGQFDTQVLKAIEEGRPLPEGIDYQQGERCGTATLREAVFARDDYKCLFCGRSIRDEAIFHIHHLGYWKGDRTNRMANLGTACDKCHTPRNHKPGGILYGIEPKLRPFKGATFMTSVRWDMLKRIKEAVPEVKIRITYGTATKEARYMLKVKKSHSNDAYCMGEFHPRHRTDFVLYKKRRRNNRILEKFYDAEYIDIRDGKKKSGKDLGCERTNRREPRNSDKNKRIFHGLKISKGKRSIRRNRYSVQPGDIVRYDGKIFFATGCHNKGTRVILNIDDKKKSVPISKVKVHYHTGGWTLE